MTIKHWLGTLLAVFVGWVAVLASVALFTDAAPGAIVLFPADDFTAQLPENAAVVGGGAVWLAIRGDGPDLGKSLYRAGGRLVLPAGLPGCLPLPSAN
ncbi:hypothetical protein ROA7450_00054 [Roseovarius albus]|uniref:Uncharacterized protein n=1 Tax=Roseovarius albus TaxID=1247867 RepID=A0A1X6Y5Z3_9RHOB|nr:hypothetical protein [Roseovarius albus]SLN11024.1 hypothetical protein ROA7450_00054 [Roseovarius albus]